MTNRVQALELLHTELSKLCAVADSEGFEMIAYFIETAMRECNEQLNEATRAVVGPELRMGSQGGRPI